MKHTTLFVILIAGLVSASCKKSYTCDCVASSTDSNLAFSVSNTSTAYSKKMTEKQAKAACEHEQLTIQSSIESLQSNAPIQDPGAMASVACTLK